MLINLYQEFYKDVFLKWIILLNLIIYIPIIIIIPGFILDDYYLFYIISQTPSIPISPNPGEAFFLFMRPLSYFSFWIDYHIFYANPLLIKLISIILHIILVLSFYYLLKKLTFIFIKRNDNLLIFLATLLFSFHLDNAIWIYWISNKTELLAVLFYVLSIFAFVKFIEEQKKYYLILCTIFFLASITSKQTGLHLPVLFIFITYLMNWKYNFGNKRKIIFFTALGLVIMILFSAVNYYVFKSEINLSQIIWKKPFSFIGNFLHVIVPYYSQDIYNIFLINKISAIILFGVLVIAILSSLIISKKEKSKTILIGIIFVFIISYPRIYAVAEPRINGILIFWFVTILVLGMHLLKKRIYMTIMPMVLIYFLITLFIRIGELKNKIDSYEVLIGNYISTINKTEKNDYVIVAENNFTLNYQAYYKIYNRFGCIDGVVNSPVFYDVSLVYFDIEGFSKPFISVYHYKNSFKVESLNDLIYLSINRKKLKEYYIFNNIIPQIKSRDYRLINFTLGDQFPIQNYSLIYFNGIDWVILE